MTKTRLASLLAVAALLAGGDLLACGDKFLVGSRGTRYQRPKNARAATILIYGSPSSAQMQAFLARQGHRATVASTFEQLSTIVSGSRFDVVLVATDVASKVQQLFVGNSGAAVVLAVDAHPKAAALLAAVDKAVEQHDQNLRRNSHS